MLFGHGQSDVDTATSVIPVAAARRRMVILCIVLIVLGIVEMSRFLFTGYAGLLDNLETAQAAVTAATEAAEPEAAIPAALTLALEEAEAAVLRGRARLAAAALAMLMLVYLAVVHRRRVKTTAEIANAVTVMIILVGLVFLASRVMLQRAIPAFVVWGLADLIVLHLAVCMIMPWKWKEATLPFAPLMLVWALAFLMPGATDIDILDRVVAVIISPVLLAPGALIASWRDRRRQEDAERRILGERVELFGGELSRARIVHDAMFPGSLSGHVCFEYEYQPIQEIGGDYVHVHTCPRTGRLTLTLLDVAGHGLAAALTVNRLFGELERILAENAAAEPAEIMELLNRYINLTMSRHSLFATGTCMSVDPCSGTLEWVNAGHPPALLRRGDSSIIELATTTMLLGVLEPESFAPEPERTKMNPGDVVIAYTDGAFEARDAEGVRFGMDRIRETARFDPPPRSWPRFIAGAVAQHHDGHADDDVLIAAVTLRSLRVPDRSEARVATDAGAPQVVSTEA
jgi:serine phosphatase RsbU (regulator of sigma subunit)